MEKRVILGLFISIFSGYACGWTVTAVNRTGHDFAGLYISDGVRTLYNQPVPQHGANGALKIGVGGSCPKIVQAWIKVDGSLANEINCNQPFWQDVKLVVQLSNGQERDINCNALHGNPLGILKQFEKMVGASAELYMVLEEKKSVVRCSDIEVSFWKEVDQAGAVSYKMSFEAHVLDNLADVGKGVANQAINSAFR